MGWWVEDTMSLPNGTVILISWVTWVIGSIILHELAHGWTALKLGDTTPRDLGHMTWNPLVHMGPVALIIFALLGITWGQMPVDPTRLRGRYGDVLVSIAGPGMNVLLAIASIVGLIAWVFGGRAAGVDEPLYSNFTLFFQFGIMLNIALALFNMIPIMPLDGGRIATSLIPAYARFAESENGRWVMLGGFMLVFWFAGGFIFLPGILLSELVSIAISAPSPFGP
ncbi:MAG: site-2 protease family protein [Planctomycetota bacterium]